MNSVIIKDLELQDLPNKLGLEVESRMLFKIKGIPMVGDFYPEFDNDYEYIKIRLEHRCETEISWKKIK